MKAARSTCCAMDRPRKSTATPIRRTSAACRATAGCCVPSCRARRLAPPGPARRRSGRSDGGRALGWTRPGTWSAGLPDMPGDERVLVSPRARRRAPAADLVAARRARHATFDLDLPGEVDAPWYPDGRALLLVHEHAGRSQLFRLDLEPRAAGRVADEPGTIAAADARPDGRVWYLWSDSATPPEVRSTSGGVVLAAPGEPAPAGVRYTDLTVGSVPRLRRRARQAARRTRRSSSSTAGPRRTIATLSRRRSRRGWTTGSPSCSSITAAAAAMAAPGETR